MRELEGVATESGDKPTHECFIKDCGELPAGASLKPPLQVRSTSGDCVFFAAWNGCDWDQEMREVAARNGPSALDIRTILLSKQLFCKQLQTFSVMVLPYRDNFMWVQCVFDVTAAFVPSSMRRLVLAAECLCSEVACSDTATICLQFKGYQCISADMWRTRCTAICCFNRVLQLFSRFRAVHSFRRYVRFTSTGRELLLSCASRGEQVVYMLTSIFCMKPHCELWCQSCDASQEGDPYP